MIKNEVERISRVYGDKFKQHLDEIQSFLNFTVKHFEKKDKLTIMEIGICFGANLAAMGNVLTLHKKDVYAVGVDFPNQSIWGGHDIDPRETIKRANPTFRYDIVVGDSHEATTLEKVKTLTKSVDLLFIDGDHSDVGFLKDFDMYKTLVPVGGLIAVHDTKFYAPWPHVAVWKVWDEMKTKYTYHEFSYHDKYGIGVIEVS